MISTVAAWLILAIAVSLLLFTMHQIADARDAESRAAVRSLNGSSDNRHVAAVINQFVRLRP